MKPISKIKQLYKRLMLSIQLHQASRQADQLFRQTGTIHFVVKGQHGHLLVLTRNQYKKLVTKGKAQFVNSHQMYQGCLYCTHWYGIQNETPKEVIRRKKRIWLIANGVM